MQVQATLPIKDGSLGIKQVRSLALPAFSASAASTFDLQFQILSASSCAFEDYSIFASLSEKLWHVAKQAIVLGYTR